MRAICKTIEGLTVHLSVGKAYHVTGSREGGVLGIIDESGEEISLPAGNFEMMDMGQGDSVDGINHYCDCRR